MERDFERAAHLVASSTGLLITAGAGMGVDSGLPDFRGSEGFWKAYPALAQAGIQFTEIANPEAFERAPRQAWGFYGHRLRLYRETEPHDGFRVLHQIAGVLPQGAFVFTSNVDGQFQKSGFSERKICEVHGSIHHLQCLASCGYDIWSADYLEPRTDDVRCEWLGQLPICRHCGKLARPNILMFDDFRWLDERTEDQYMHLNAWLKNTSAPVVVEMGAGLDIPTVRAFSQRQGVPLIRINPMYPGIPDRAGVSLRCSALAGLQGIKQALIRIGFLPDTPNQTLAP